MSLKPFEITKNDSLPSLQYTLSRSGSTTPNLTGCTVSYKVRRAGASTNAFTLAVTSSGGTGGQITSTTNAVVRLDWSTGHWGSSGSYSGELSISNSAGKVETALDRQSIVVRSEY